MIELRALSIRLSLDGEHSSAATLSWDQPDRFAQGLTRAWMTCSGTMLMIVAVISVEARLVAGSMTLGG